MLPRFLLALTLAAAPPAQLSLTGLYEEGRVAAGNLRYSPQYPLWSDGAGKSRWIALPPGTAIGTQNPGAWDFPVGTKFWKEFAFGGRKVETRMLWKAAETEWVYAAYRWREDQRDADLAPAAGVGDTADLGGGLSHAIPSTADCRACHENGPTPVLGFTALQLSPDRDPLAPHAEPLEPDMATLRTLAERRLLDPPLPPGPAPRIQADSPRARAVLGYLATNCGTCHTPASPIRGVSLDLTPGSGTATTVGRLGHYRIPGDEAPSSIVRPGDPGHSSLLYRMASGHAEARMPPMGNALPDREAAELVRAWIASLRDPGDGRTLPPGPAGNGPSDPRRAP
ncbi:hypothetical protein [Geothrix sp. 21YS21S-2]|uniref:hypothetical protein n=1 Tax=Geothrix sp. 21YS21S-2 TaxID=3068893 RepID=UPI0027B9C67E|nr:hypothetical protein [Geothrix sp. 21YS21S-2]